MNISQQVSNNITYLGNIVVIFIKLKVHNCFPKGASASSGPPKWGAPTIYDAILNTYLAT